jgi:adenylosuccinate lyase
MRVNRKKMRENLEMTGGLIFSHPLLLLLVGKGLAREKAYVIIQDAAMKSMEGKKSFREYLAEDRRFTDLVSDEELAEAFDLKSHLKNIDFIFSRVLSKTGRPGKG